MNRLAKLTLLVLSGLVVGCAFPSPAPTLQPNPPASQTSLPIISTQVKVGESIVPLAVTSTGNAPISSSRVPTTSVSDAIETLDAPAPAASVTPSPIASPVILYGTYSQQPGWATDDFVGKNTPSFALYSDGTLLIRSSKYINGIEWYDSVRLDHSQICWLINQIARTGIFDMNGDGTLGFEDPIYQFDQSTSLTDPGVGIANILKISAEQTKWVQFIPNSRRWLANPLKKVLDLLDAYQPPGSLQPYSSQRVLLWIEKGRGSYEYATRQPPNPTGWPQNLPVLSDLIGDQLHTKVLLSGKEAEQVQKLYNYRPVGKLFVQNGIEYFVIARPLLPDETIDQIALIPKPEEDYTPLLTCNDG